MLLSDPVHITNLRHMARSPAHYAAAVCEPREPNSGMRFGTVTHAVLFRQPYVIYDGGDRRGKRWDDFRVAHPDDLIITDAEYSKAMRCCDAIGANAEATRVLVGDQEKTRRWSTLGRACEGTPDVANPNWVTELKTTSNSEPSTFLRGALRMGYHAQLPWYMDGIGLPNAAAYIVAVETSPPFAVSVFRLTERCLNEGRKLCRLWMEQLLNCEASDEWPAYCQSVVPFDVPDYDEPLIIDGEEVDAA